MQEHKTKRRIICILCASIIALYALAIPIGAVVNSSQVPEGSTALYGQSTFPYSVGFVCSDENLDRNYIFATEIGTYGLNNNQTIFGEDQFEWHYPDSTDTETTLIEYSGVDQLYLRDSLRWYANRSIEYGSNYGYTYGGFGQMNLEYYTNTQDFVDNVESIIFKASDVYYNTIWLTHQDAINTFSYLENPTPIQFMMPTVSLPSLDDYTTKAFVGAYSVECSILDDRGNTHNISYSVPIDTREKVPLIPFIEYSALKPFIVLNNDGSVNDAQSSKTLLITEYRGYLDVDYYEYVEPNPIEEISGIWTINSNADTSTLPNGDLLYSTSSINHVVIRIGESDYSSTYPGWANVKSGGVYPILKKSSDGSFGIINSSGTTQWIGQSQLRTYDVDFFGQITTEQIQTIVAVDSLLPWLQANATKQVDTNEDGGSAESLAEEGTWEIVSDSREKNKVTVTFPMYDTSESQGIPPYASTLLSYPSASKFVQNTVANLDTDLPENTDWTGWIGTAVGGFLDFELFDGFSLGGLLSILIGFSFIMLFLKFFAGG